MKASADPGGFSHSPFTTDMPTLPIHRSVAILALWSGLAWPGDSAGLRDSSASGQSAMERALPKDAFRKFLQESRSREDSLHYQQGEIALGQEEFDLALSHHLAADLPAAGKFRNDLLDQRSRIFARLWPSAAPDGKEAAGKDLPQGMPAFDWGVGAEHSRGMDRTGPQFPYGTDGLGEENREWKYRTYARRYWPVSFGKNEMNLGLSANANRSSLGGASNYEAALEAEMPQGMREDAFLSFSAGLGKAPGLGARRYYGLLASKTWYFRDVDADFEAGYSRQWDHGWKALGDDAWIKASRDFSLTGGNGIHASLEVAATRRQSRDDRYTVPVLYVNDVAGDSLNTLSPFSSAAAGKTLTLEAPQSFFSFSPSLSYAFSMPAGLQAQAGAWYALDVYPEYAWDRIPWPDSLDPDSGDLAGLALSRADGRYYPALMVEQDGNYQGYFGAAPLERVKTRRVDNRMGLDFKLGKDLPGGYSVSVESSAELRRTNLARTAPTAFRPWQWGLAFSVSRSLYR